MMPAAASAQESNPEARGTGATSSSQIVAIGQSLTKIDVATPLPVIVLTGYELAHRRRGTLGETLDGLASTARSPLQTQSIGSATEKRLHPLAPVSLICGAASPV